MGEAKSKRAETRGKTGKCGKRAAVLREEVKQTLQRGARLTT